MNTKTCKKCNQPKSLNSFHSKTKSKDGLQAWCKSCFSINTRKHVNSHRKNSEVFRTLDNIINRLNKILNSGKIYDVNSKYYLIFGLLPSELKAYLIKTFEDRYGVPYTGQVVEVDHIIPKSTAQTIDEVYKLNHYTNLQYLTPEDNKLKFLGSNI